MKKVTPTVIGLSLGALSCDQRRSMVGRAYGEQPEPLRASISVVTTSGNATLYNQTLTAEDVMQPLHLLGEAPTPDLNAQIAMVIRRINGS